VEGGASWRCEARGRRHGPRQTQAGRVLAARIGDARPRRAWAAVEGSGRGGRRLMAGCAGWYGRFCGRGEGKEAMEEEC